MGNGPRWLAYPNDQLDQKEITLTRDSEKEAKMIKEVMCIATEESEEIYQLLNRFYRFLENCNHKEKLSGPVKTIETEKQKYSR